MNEERTGSSNNNCNVSVVICGTDIPLRLTNKGNNKITEHRAIFQRERKTHKSINRQSQSTTGKLGKPPWPWLGTGISKEMVG